MHKSETSNARSHSLSAVSAAVRVHEFAVAHGRFKAKLTIPSKGDLSDFIRLRDLIAKVEMQALMVNLRTATRIELFEQADELRLQIDAIPQIVTMEDEFDNVVTTVGKNLALDTYLAGSAYTVVGPYLALIGAVSYTGVPVIGDIMTSHATWTEGGTVNAPTYTAPRKTAVFSSASAGSKAISPALSFAMTGTGTAKGCFIVYGTGALTTIDNTAGTLYSAGLFTGGDQPVVNGNTLSVSYSTSL